MTELRELTADELSQVSGSGGTPTLVSGGYVTGGQVWEMTCGSGYAIHENSNFNINNTSTWSNPADYYCSGGETGVKYYDWIQADSGQMFNFGEAMW